MNEEYAIDPAVASRVTELRLLLSKFGFYEGRFVSRFPKRWLAQALDGITDQILRQRVQVLLEHAKEHAFLPSGRTYDAAKPWIANAIAQQCSSTPFDSVISLERRPETVHIDDLDPANFRPARDRRVTGTVANIMNAVRPLLRLSGNLVLIDPYFRPWATNIQKLLEEVLRESFGARCISFTAFVSGTEWLHDMNRAESLIADALPKLAAGRKIFSVIVCDDLATTSGLHARYLFSEKGGIRLDKGLRTDRVKVDISFIDGSVHEDLMKTYVERPLPFNTIKEFSYQL